MNRQLVKLGLVALAAVFAATALFRWGPLELKTIADSLSQTSATVTLQTIGHTGSKTRRAVTDCCRSANPKAAKLAVEAKQNARTKREIKGLRALPDDHLRNLEAIPNAFTTAGRRLEQALNFNDPEAAYLLIKDVLVARRSGAPIIIPGAGYVSPHDPSSLRSHILRLTPDQRRSLLTEALAPAGQSEILKNVFLAAIATPGQAEAFTENYVAAARSESEFISRVDQAVNINQLAALSAVVTPVVTDFAKQVWPYLSFLEDVRKAAVAAQAENFPRAAAIIISPDPAVAAPVLTGQMLNLINAAPRGDVVSASEPPGVSRSEIIALSQAPLVPEEEALRNQSVVNSFALENLDVFSYPYFFLLGSLPDTDEDAAAGRALFQKIDDINQGFAARDSLTNDDNQRALEIIARAQRIQLRGPLSVVDLARDSANRLALFDAILFSPDLKDLRDNLWLYPEIANAMSEGALGERAAGELQRFVEYKGINSKKLVEQALSFKRQADVIRRAYSSSVTFDRSTGRLYYSGIVYEGVVETSGNLVANKQKPLGVLSIDPFTGKYNGRVDLRLVNKGLRGDLTINPRTGDLVLWYNLRPAAGSSTISLKSKFSLDKVAVAGDGSIGGEIKAFGKTLRYNPITRAPEVPIRIAAKGVLAAPATIYVDAKGNITGELPFKVSGTQFGLYLDRGGNIALGTEISAGGNQIGAVAISSKGVLTGSVDVLKLAGVKGVPGLGLVFSTKGGFQGVNVPIAPSFGVFIGKDGNLGFAGFIPVGPIPVPVGLSFNDRGQPVLRFPGGKSNVGKWPVVGSVLTGTVGKLFGSTTDKRPRSKPPPKMKDDGTVDLSVRFYPSKVRKALGNYTVWNEYFMTPEQQKARAELIHDIFKTTLGRPPTDAELLNYHLYANEHEADPGTRPHWTNDVIAANAEERKQVLQNGGPEAAWKRYEEEQKRIEIEANPIGAILDKADKTADPSLLDESALEGLSVLQPEVLPTASPLPLPPVPGGKQPPDLPQEDEALAASPTPTSVPVTAPEPTREPPKPPSDRLVIFEDEVSEQPEQVTAPITTPSQTTPSQPRAITLTLKRGWNLVTIPLKLRVIASGIAPFAEFEAIRSLGASGYYDSAAQLPQASEAFWAFSSRDTAKSLTGVVPLLEPLPSSRVTVELKKGWNIVGNPYNQSLPIQDRTFTVVTSRERVIFSQALERKFISPIFVYDTAASSWRQRAIGEELQRNQSFAVQSGGEVILEFKGR